ncbi:NAD(P)/FAD-dependent oxidoreductase [Catenulispora pinisilvae]|uniref:NAD(P)/FAD-dependent oxidoreductase n=1 Tax=Catenulispora pinisilvae TaxID=2705253 RepID=UPI001890C1A8
MFDVLIVGGGPIGLATACYVAEAGLSAVVAEPRTGPIDKACGEGLMPPAVAALRALGVDPVGRRLRGIRYCDPTHSVDAEFRSGPGRGVRRTVLHTALAERAEALGVELVPKRITEFSQSAACVQADGLSARFLVAADGLHSPIRRACDLDPTSASTSAPALVPASASPSPSPSPRQARYGLRRHFQTAPWTDFVEVHWSRASEAYVTPVDDGLVGVAILGPAGATFEERLAAFPALRERLADAEAGPVRGAGPLRQAVRRRVAPGGRVLLVGDASGYVDALTGEGISVGLAQARALAACLGAGRPGEYERRWHRVSRRSNLLTAALLAARRNPVLGPRIVPAAGALPAVFGGAVRLIAG